MAFLDVDGILLHHTVNGNQDAPSLVFINSLGTDLRIWDGVVPHFSDRFRVVRYDKRGHGLSDCPPAPYRIDHHTADLAGLLDRLDIENAILVGISVGGMIAMQFATAWRDRVGALVLCDTAPVIGTTAMWNERIGMLRAHGMAHLSEAILARWFATSFRETNKDATRGYANMLTRTPVEGYAGTCEAIRDTDLRSVVTNISVPTLVLCGAEDVATTPEQARELAMAIPGAQFGMIEGAAHLPCIERPAALANRLRAFFQENGYV